ncbi:MAG: hypothetical protein HYY24_29560 [Verrucomicrobia bacterium]|nr:hypothetical protein [Verrucomicrobiota bacterium]
MKSLSDNARPGSARPGALPRLTRFAVLAGVILALCTSIVCAEQGTSKAKAKKAKQASTGQEQEMYVTGSRIKQKFRRFGTTTDSALNVTIIGTREFERVGGASAAGALGKIPTVRVRGGR